MNAAPQLFRPGEVQNERSLRSRHPPPFLPGADAVQAAASHLPPLCYPHITSSSPPILPTPASVSPCFVPLGATVPLPRRWPRSNRRTVKGKRPLRRQAPALARPPSGSPDVTTTPASAPVGENDNNHARPPLLLRVRPGVSFCDLVLLHFHELVVPAGKGTPATPEATFWMKPELGSVILSKVQVGNALNFRFSRPPHRFEVRSYEHGYFSAIASSKNLASFIVSRGRCKVGGGLPAPLPFSAIRHGR